MAEKSVFEKKPEDDDNGVRRPAFGANTSSQTTQPVAAAAPAASTGFAAPKAPVAPGAPVQSNQAAVPQTPSAPVHAAEPIEDKKKVLVESFAEQADGNGSISDSDFDEIMSILRKSRNRNNSQR